MVGPLAAVPWLIRGAPRLWPWLMRGKGVNLPLRKTAQGVDKVVRSKIDPYDARVTYVDLLKKALKIQVSKELRRERQVV